MWYDLNKQLWIIGASEGEEGYTGGRKFIKK